MLAAGARSYTALDRFVGDCSGARAKEWYAGIQRAWPRHFHDRPWPEGLDAERFPEAFADRVRTLDGAVETGRSDRRFDVVTPWQVGEHVKDIRAFASLTAELMRPGGSAVHRVDFGPHDC